MVEWRFYHSAETESTNLDARSGSPGDVFTTDYQTAGRGRLDHRWESARGANLLMSVVLGVAGIAAEEVATLPLVIGLSAVKAIGGELKWPNDVLVGGAKVAGILCERHEDRVIVGIGVNLNQPNYASIGGEREVVKKRLLDNIAREYARWRREGFAAIYPELAAIDFLKGRAVSVRQQDEDARPIRGVCAGIAADGALVVGGKRIYAGEAHVEEFGER